MTLRTDWYDYIIADGGISALISTRFYWQQIAENPTWPASKYLVVARPNNTAHDGPSGLETITMQVDHLSDDDGETESVAEAFKTACNGVKSGSLKMIMTGESDIFEDSGDLWRITQEYLIHHKS